MKYNDFLQNILRCLLASIVLAPAFAADSTWNGGAGTWSSTGNWTPAAVPDGATDSATFLAAATPELNQDATLNSLVITSGSAITLAPAASQKLIFAGTDPTITVLGADHAITANLRLDATVQVYVAAGRIFTLSGVISGSGGILKTGPGTLRILGTNPNTFTGNLMVGTGVIELQKTAGTNACAGSVSIGYGILRLLASHQLPDTTTIDAGDAVFDLNNQTEVIGSLSSSRAGQVLLGSGTLTITEASSRRIDGNISGTGTVVMNGTGTLTLAGDNTGIPAANNISWSGACTVAAGTLVAAHAGALGTTGTGTTVAAGATLGIEGGITLAEPVTLTGGTNPARLHSRNGTNSHGGVLTLAAGAAGDPVQIQADSGTLTLTVANVLGATHPALEFAGGGDLVLNAAFTCGFRVATKNGSGTLTLANAANTCGGFTLNAGRVVANHANSFSTGTVVLAGGTLVVPDAFILYNDFHLNGDATIAALGTTCDLWGAWNLNGGYRTLTLSNGSAGVHQIVLHGIMSNGTLAKAGNDELHLAAANTLSSITVMNGQLKPLAPGAVGSVQVNAGAVLNLTSVPFGACSLTALIGAGSVNLGSTNLLLNLATNSYFDGTITGAGNVTKAGSGTLRLTNPNLGYSGSTTVSDGLWQMVGDSAALTATSTINLNGGAFEITAAGTFNPNRLPDTVTINLAGGEFRMYASGSDRLENIGRIVATTGTASTVRLSATGNYRCQLTATDAIKGIDRVATAGFSLWRDAVAPAQANLFSNNGWTNNATVPFAQVKEGSGSYATGMYSSISGLTNPTTATSKTTAGGTGTDWSDPTTWVPNGVPAATDDVLITKDIALDGLTGPALCRNLTIGALGTLTATSAGTQTTADRVVKIHGDLLTFDDRGGAAAYSLPATVHLFANNSWRINIAVAGGGNTITLLGYLGRDYLTKSGAGTLVLSRDNDRAANDPLTSGAFYYDHTIVENGVLRIASAYAVIYQGGVPTNTTCTINGGTLDLNGFAYTPSSLTGSSGAITTATACTLTVGAVGGTFSGALSGPLALVVTNGLSLGGSNSNTGGITVSGGTLALVGPGAVADTCAVQIAGTASMQVRFAETIGPLSGSGSLVLDAALTVDQGSTVSAFTGSMVGIGLFTLSSSGSGGTLTLGGSNSQAGGTKVSGGTLVVASNANLGQAGSPFTLAGGCLRLAGDVNMTGSAVASVAHGTRPGVSMAAATTRPVTVTGGTFDLGSSSLALPGFSTTTAQGFTVTANNDSSDRALFIVTNSNHTWAGPVLSAGANDGFGYLIATGTGALYLADTSVPVNPLHPNIIRVEGGTLGATTGSLGSVATEVRVLNGATLMLQDMTLGGLPLYLGGSLATNGNNAWTGSVVLDFGGVAPPSVPSVTVNDGSLTLGDPTHPLTSLSGSGQTWTKLGAGILVLANQNSTSDADLAIRNGTVQISADRCLGQTSANVALGQTGNSCVLRTTANLSLAATRTLTLSASSVIQTDPGKTCTVLGQITGAGTLVKTGTGTLVATQANAWSGGTVLAAGTLSVSADQQLGAPANLTGSGGTIAFTAGLTVDPSRTLSLAVGGLTVQVDPGVNVDWSAAFSGSGTGTLTKTGTGSLRLGGNSPAFGGSVLVSAGQIEVAHANALGTAAAGTTVAPGATVAFSGGISCNEPLTVDGGGAGGLGALRNLSGANAVLGPILLNSTQPVRLAADAGSLGVNGQISGANAITVSGSGSVLFGNSSNTFTGNVTISGRLDIGADGALGAPGNGIVFAGGTLGITNSLTTNRTVTMAGTGGFALGVNKLVLPAFATATGQDLTLSGAAGTIEFSGSSDRTMTGILSGDLGTIRKSGSATVTLAGANTFTGAMVVADGVLEAAHASALGSATVGTTVQPAGILAIDAVAVTEPLQLAGGTLRKNANGSGSLSGGIQLSAPSAIRCLSGGQFTVASPIAGAFLLTLGGDAAGGSSVSGAIAATVTGVTKDGTGTWTLANPANAFTGQLNIAQGVLRTAASEVIPDASDVVLADGTQLVLGTGCGETVARITTASASATAAAIAIAGGTLTTATEDTGLFSGTIGGSGGLAKSGTGLWRLSGANAFTGSVAVAGGTVRLEGANGAFSAPSGISVTAGGTLNLSNSAATNADRIGDTVPLTLDGGGLTLSGGTSAVTENLGALTVLTGSSVVTVSAGASVDAALACADLASSAGGQLSFQRVNGASGGVASLLAAKVAGTAVTANLPIVAFANVNGEPATYLLSPLHLGLVNATRRSVADGPWHATATWLGGVVPAADDDVIIGHQVALTADATCHSVQFTGSMPRVWSVSGKTLTIGNGSVTTSATTTTATIGLGAAPAAGDVGAAVASGLGGQGWAKLGLGTLTLSGVGSFTGAADIQQGTLVLAPGGSLALAARVRVAGGATLRLDASATLAELTDFGSVQLNGGSVVLTLAPGTGQAKVPNFGGVIDGSGGLTLAGPGWQALGGANLYTGPTLIQQGYLLINGAATLGAETTDAPAGSGVVVSGNGSLALAYGARIPAGKPLSIGNGAVVNAYGLNTVDAAITLTGPATLANLADTTLPDDTGSLTLNGSVATGGYTLTLNGDAVNKVSTVNGRITGSGGLGKDGAAIWELAGGAAHDYSGPTALIGGTLLVNGTISASTTTVASGATLAGQGSLAAVSVQDGGTIAPGQDGVGSLSTGTLTLAAAALVDLDLGTASDLVQVRGDLVLDGRLTVANSGGFASGDYTLFTVGGTITDNNLTIASLPGAVAHILKVGSGSVVLTIDTVAPAIAAIASANADGTYYAGDTIDVTVEFTKPAALTGGLAVTLNTGVTVAIPASATAVTSVSASWTVVAGQTTPTIAPGKLDATAIAFAPGGSLTDLAGNVTTGISLPGSTIALTATIVVANQAPQVTVNNAGYGNANPPAQAIQLGEIVLFSAVLDGTTSPATRRLTAKDRETTDPADLTYVLRIEPSQGQVECRTDAGSPWVTVLTTGATTSFTQAQVDAGDVRYRYLAVTGGNDAFAFVVVDGDGTESPLTLMRFSASGNAPPAISGFPATFAWSEPADKTTAAQVVGNASTVTDTDTSFTGGTLTIAMAGGETGDELWLVEGAVSISGATLAIGGTTVGTLSGQGSANLVVTFAAQAGPAQATSILRSIGYRFSGAAPDPALTRRVEVAITDGSPGGLPGVATAVVAITPSNDPPLITAPAGALLTVPGIARRGTITAVDPEGDTALIYRVTAFPTKGVLSTLDATGRLSSGPAFTYTPDLVTAASATNPILDTFTIEVSDNGFTPGSSEARRRGTAAPATASITWQVRITDTGAVAPVITSNPPFQAVQDGRVDYTPTVSTAGLAAPQLVYHLIGLEGVSPAPAFGGVIGGTTATEANKTLNWLSVPRPATGYQRFGILVLDEANGVAAYQPITIQVLPLPSSGG